MSNYGRNRDSIADIERELDDIFNKHPDAHVNDQGELVVPADALVDVLRSFSDVDNSIELLTESETEMLKQLLDSNPGIQVTPHMLLQFVAVRSKQSPPAQSSSHSPDFDLSPSHSPRMEDDHTLPLRGRMPTRDDDDDLFSPQSRSSSKSSTDTSRAPSRPPSRPPSTTPQTPMSGNAFDKRQRSTPLSAAAAPSSWQRRRPTQRRRSSSRAMSDSESSDTSFSQTPGDKSRRPSASSVASPSLSSASSSVGAFSPSSTSASSIGSPSPTWDRSTKSQSASRSRPHSRAQSYNSFAIAVPMSPDPDHSSSDEPGSPLDQTPDSSFEYPSHGGGSNLANQVSSLPMPRMGGNDGSDNDSDEEDEVAAGLVLDRSTTSSMVSLEPQERLEALQKANTDMSRKLAEAERTLQKKLLEHEMDMEEMQGKLDELKSELTATKREEKELRAKERANSTQLASLEQEVAKLNKALDNARTAYQSLQKQYQEQCNESERYRNTLRRRDQEIKDMQDAAGLQQIEQQKWLRERDSYDARIDAMEEDLVVAQQAHVQLDEQKQENLMLKETIDRLRYDMDEMRNSTSQAAAAAGGANLSARNSISKSLGAELLKMKDGHWNLQDEDDILHEAGEVIQIDAGEEDDGEDTEGEDVVEHHVITRTKRRIGGRKTETLKITETKEYTEVAIQHEPSLSTCEIQTDPEPRPLLRGVDTQTDDPPVTPTASTEIQTDKEPIAPKASMEIQTEPVHIAPPKITMAVEIQTDEPEPETAPEPATSDDEETLASSSTAVPPTPKQQENDLPPSYNQVEEQEVDEEEREWRVVTETLRKWHRGMQSPLDTLPQGISEDAVEEWRALKEELGVECAVIDKLVEASPRTGRPRRSSSSASGSSGRDSKRNRFYNIYNTYVYGTKDPSDPSLSSGVGSTLGVAAKQLLVGVGASAFVFLAMSPYLSPNNSYGNQYAVPGGPTYYDRAAWSAFNSMQPPGEGFGFDGTAALWNIIGRVGVGAARIAGGFPT